MNIVEAYIKFKGQLLIFVSGLSGCGKLALGKSIEKDFKLKLIDQFDYYKKDYDVTVSLPDGTKLINWYSDDAVDWDKLNDDIDKSKLKGLVVVGFSLPENKVRVPDYHFHLNAPKQLCVEKRKTFLENNKEKHEEEYKLIGTQTEKLKMNQLIFPYYLESIKNSKINKFINIKQGDDKFLTEDEIYDEAYDILINFIRDFLYTPNATSSDNTKTPKVTHVSKPKKEFSKFQRTDDESTSASFELGDSDYIYDDKENMDMVSSLEDTDDYEENDGPIVAIPQ